MAGRWLVPLPRSRLPPQAADPRALRAVRIHDTPTRCVVDAAEKVSRFLHGREALVRERHRPFDANPSLAPCATTDPDQVHSPRPTIPASTRSMSRGAPFGTPSPTPHAAPLGQTHMNSRCRYCNSSSFGPGCPSSPTRVHDHSGDAAKCEFCGSSSYGPGCPHSPSKRHRHGPGAKCRWCGSSSHGPGCPHSPGRVHER